MLEIITIASGVVVFITVMIGHFRYPERVYASTEGFATMCGGALMSFILLVTGICLLVGVDVSRFWVGL